jgi:hypothetical protein
VACGLAVVFRVRLARSPAVGAGGTDNSFVHQRG